MASQETRGLRSVPAATTHSAAITVPASAPRSISAITGGAQPAGREGVQGHAHGGEQGRDVTEAGV